MSSLVFSIVDRPESRQKKPAGAYDELIQALKRLPPGKAIKVPAKLAGREGSFRSSVCMAAKSAGTSASVTKGEGVYYVSRRLDVMA